MDKLLLKLDTLVKVTKKEYTLELTVAPALGGRLLCYSHSSPRAREDYDKPTYISDWYSSDGLLILLEAKIQEPPF